MKLTKFKIDEINKLFSNSELKENIRNEVIEFKIEIGGIKSNDWCSELNEQSQPYNKYSFYDVKIFDEIFKILQLNLKFSQYITILDLIKNSTIPIKETININFQNSKTYEIWNIPLETFYETLNEVV